MSQKENEMKRKKATDLIKKESGLRWCPCGYGPLGNTSIGYEMKGRQSEGNREIIRTYYFCPSCETEYDLIPSVKKLNKLVEDLKTKSEEEPLIKVDISQEKLEKMVREKGYVNPVNPKDIATLLVDMQNRLTAVEGLTTLAPKAAEIRNEYFKNNEPKEINLGMAELRDLFVIWCPYCMIPMKGSSSHPEELGETIDIIKCPTCAFTFSPSHDSVGQY